MVEDSYESLKAVWNMDDAICKSVYYYKCCFVACLKNNNLEKAYWNLRYLRMEIDAKFKDSEREDIEADLKLIENKRILFLKNPYNNNLRQSLFNALENYYLKLNRLMKSHGLYFREGEDPRRAVLMR